MITKREHHIWSDWQKIKDQVNTHPSSIVGQYQYLIESDKGIISIVELPNYFMDGVDLWEIYCIKGDLFEDIQRFSSYDEALAEAKKYLYNIKE